MSRCENPEQMSMQEFKDLLWIDDTMSVYIDDRKNRRAGVSVCIYVGERGRARQRARARARVRACVCKVCVCDVPVRLSLSLTPSLSLSLSLSLSVCIVCVCTWHMLLWAEDVHYICGTSGP